MITLDKINEAFHAIAIKDSTNSYELLIDASGHITANINGTVAVTQSGAWSVDLDAGAEVIVTDGTDTLAIAADGSIAVTATELDIRDLTHVSDSIKIGDGTDFLAINADGSVNAQTVPAAMDTWQTSTVSASSVVAEIAATPLANRLSIIIQNLGNHDCYIGEDNTVTISSGIMVPAGSSMRFPYGASANIWAICDTGKTASLRIAEYAD